MATLSRKIVKGENDGYVLHDTSSVDNNNVTLILGYDGYDDLSTVCDIWTYFEDLPIPYKSIITSATLQLNAYGVYNGGISTRYYANLDNNNITSYSDYANINATENYTSFYLDESGDGAIFSVDLTAVVQEKVNNKAWSSGSNLLLFTKETVKDESESFIDIDSYEYEQNALLTIEYVPADVITKQTLFQNNRYEYFEYEHLKLENGKLTTITDNISHLVNNANININFENTIINTANFITNNNTAFSFNDVIRPYYCTIYDEKIFKYPLGTYFIKAPKKDFDEVIMYQKMKGFDITSVLEEDKIIQSLTIPSGTVVTSYIESLISGTGSWIKYNIEESTETLSESLSYVAGKSKLFIINSLLNAINYYPVWADGSGTIRSIPWTDEPNITWYFKDDNTSLYKGKYVVESDYNNTMNRVTVIANQLTADTEPLVSTKTFEDIGLTEHPYSYTNLGRYVTKTFQSEATSQSYVDSRAERELRKSLEIEEAINYQHAFVTNRDGDGLPWNGDCFSFYHSSYSSNIDSPIYKILSHYYDLSVGSLVQTRIRRSKYFL